MEVRCLRLDITCRGIFFRKSYVLFLLEDALLTYLSGVFMTIGGALMYTTDSSSSRSIIYGYSILIAIGAGLASQAAYSIGPAKVKPHQVPAVIGFMNVAQIGGIVIALTISSTVYQNLAFKFLQSALAGLNFTAAGG